MHFQKPTLNAVVDIRRAVFLGIDVNGRGHAARLWLLVEDSDFEFIWMSAESISGGHSRCAATDDGDSGALCG